MVGVDTMKQQAKGEKWFGAYSDFIRLTIYFLIALVVCFILSSFVIQKTDVEGKSMVPTLEEQDVLLIAKIAYYFEDPKRYDVVVFPQKGKKDVLYIKRIIGMPGETIQIVGDNIFINGRILSETYGKEAMEEETEGIALSAIHLKKDEYFVLGDNRNFSIDSRNKEIGPINRREIIGQAFFNLHTFSIVK